ncbi:MAG: PIG-L family deacetylase [Actinobacteria bacterium]|nr:PIG-L family deacetylase [Actinomycetota bacterium]
MPEPKRRLSAVFAHPDDDTFGIAGSLIQLGADVLDYQVIVATSGEAGLIFEGSLATRENLGEVREAEQRAALAAAGFGAADIHFLRHPDGGLAVVDQDQLVGQIQERLEPFTPEVVVTFGPEGVTGHADHIAAGAAATEAFHRLRADGARDAYRRLVYTALPATVIDGYREYLRSIGQDPGPPDAAFAPRGVPDDTIGIMADCTGVVDRKIAALREHRTQGEELESMPEEMLPVAFGIESFVIAWPEREPGPDRLPGLFAGL